jgi:hypothetical protein
MLMPEHILDPQEVIHPCLDWVKGELIVGANLQGGGSAVLSSAKGLVRLDASLGVVCEQGKRFRGAASARVADQFLKYQANEQEPEDGGKLLKDIATFVTGFVVLPQSWLGDVLSAWILGTYLFPVFQTYPYIWITSKEPGCGKSLLGGIIAKLSFNGEFMVAPTEAQLFHLPESSRGVQVWDEVENREETDTKRFNMMRPVLLNGYRNGGVVPRQIGKHFEKGARYHVFCPRVLIGLTKLPETALQRSIQVQLVKLTEEQTTKLYIGGEQAEAERLLRERCLLWALETAQRVSGCYQDEKLRKELGALLGPGRISDDIWLPMLAVASAATGDDANFTKVLKDAAKGLATSATPAVQPAAHPSMAAEVPREDARDFLKTALDRLEFTGAIAPEDLAKDICQISGQKITAQRLSKGLAKLGIKSKKKKGQRVFDPDGAERARALQQLGGEIGQQGREGGRDRGVEARL